MPNSNKDGIESIPATEIAEIIGDHTVTTSVIVEDRTENPAADREVEYEVEEIAHGDGIVETRYGEPLGGHPTTESEAH